MAARSADRQAGFILPHLRVGMRLLDCGYGPGSITVDLAAAIAPGQVEGIDIGSTQIAAARARAIERRITNVHFPVADIYTQPFPTGSFDVVFANTVNPASARPHSGARRNAPRSDVQRSPELG
jgi:ubiquinone/menaquinone biosynthesis C-methylase UbiE